ncbi:MAG: hypothetical protein ACO3JL_15385 [Myxococcota bacterium]
MAAVEQRDRVRLTSLAKTPEGRVAHPTPEHRLPLLYAFGTTNDDDTLRVVAEGFDVGTLSMRTVGFG